MSAAAVGLDFASASYVVFVEVPDTSDVLLQSEARAHRMNSKASVNVYVLTVKASSDDRTWKQLAESLERQSAVLEKDTSGTGKLSGALLAALVCLS